MGNQSNVSKRMELNRILCGDALEVLRTLPSESVQCCVTSPPYFNLRNYGIDGQIGLEAAPEDFIARLVAVFSEVKRVLKQDGTLWVNMGDSYAGGGRGGNPPESGHWMQSTNAGSLQLAPMGVPAGMKAKDLMGMPWTLALALRADGWYLRSDIIWSKPNPMPESVTDRPTKAHEYLFLLSKSDRYYYDHEAIKEPLARPDEGRRTTPAVFGGKLKHVEAGKQSRLHSGNEYTGTSDGNRNRRTVWEVSPAQFSEAHFATFPEKLIQPCIMAGSREGDTVLDPFFGAGTTGLVCKRLARNYIGIELNPDYIKIAEKRIGSIPESLFSQSRAA